LAGLFFFRSGFEAFGADFFSLAVDFFGLKIDGHCSFGGDVGVRAALGGFGSAAADLAKSRHNILSCLITKFSVS
jgi:hypothetical protein